MLNCLNSTKLSQSHWIEYTQWYHQQLIESVLINFWTTAVDFPSGYQIWCKNDQCPYYGQKSKFKMAAVRHLGILIPPYRTTHEVFLIGYISMSNFVLIRYIVLKIWRFDFFCKIGLKCLFKPQNFGFLGSAGPLKLIDHRRDPQKAHLHLKPRVMSINSFDSVHICDL